MGSLQLPAKYAQLPVVLIGCIGTLVRSMSHRVPGCQGYSQSEFMEWAQNAVGDIYGHSSRFEGHAMAGCFVSCIQRGFTTFSTLFSSPFPSRGPFAGEAGFGRCPVSGRGWVCLMIPHSRAGSICPLLTAHSGK